MKTAIISLMLFLGSSSWAFAQTEAAATDSTKADSVEVVITTKKGQDSTIVKIKGMKIIVLSDDKKETDKIIIDTDLGESADTLDNKKEDKSDSRVSHWQGIRVGVNGYLVNNGLPIPTTHSFLELDYAKSISVDVNLLEKDFHIYKNNIELVTGLGLHFANYAFKSKYETLLNTDPLSASVDSTKIFNKNKLKATYITAPLLLGFSTNQDEDKALRFAVGAQAGWRIGSKLKQEFNLGGETYSPKQRSDFDLNPFKFDAVAAIGYGPLNVFATYGLNTLFEKNKTIALTPFDIGLQLMF